MPPPCIPLCYNVGRNIYKEERIMRMEDLRYLIQVADIGSISQAAEACYITQQGLSRIISNLEKELGVTLFHRSNNRILLTDVGEVVVARAREVDALYQRMLSEISRDSNHDGRPPVDYHIYVTPLISATLLSNVMSALNLRYPGIHLNVVELTPPEIADEVEFTDNSVGIVSMPAFHEAESLRLNSGELVFDRCFRDDLMLGVAEHSPLASREMISTAELAAIPLALCSTEVLMARNLLEPGVEPVVALHVSSYDLCRDMVCRNRAAGLTSALRDHYSKCPIKAIPLEKTATISYGCIYDPNAPMTPFLKDLFGIVAKELGHIPK